MNQLKLEKHSGGKKKYFTDNKIVNYIGVFVRLCKK